MKMFRIGTLLTVVASLAAFAPAGKAQTAAGAGFSSSDAAASLPTKPEPRLEVAYKRPTEKAKLRSYLFDTFGPYPIVGAAIFGGVDQLEKTPPEWGKGAGAYGERVGSNFGIAMVTTTTRYALAEALREDTLYYRCECKGVVRRLGHAVFSTVTARYGDQGYRRLSFAAIVAPYAGSMTAVYGWYPKSYDAKDGLRMGSYALLAFGAGNIAQEFIYGGSHTLFGRGNRSASPGTYTVASSNP